MTEITDRAAVTQEVVDPLPVTTAEEDHHK